MTTLIIIFMIFLAIGAIFTKSSPGSQTQQTNNKLYQTFTSKKTVIRQLQIKEGEEVVLFVKQSGEINVYAKGTVGAQGLLGSFENKKIAKAVENYDIQAIISKIWDEKDINITVTFSNN